MVTEMVSQKGHGSFYINSSAIMTLLVNKATSIQICAYLTIARYNFRNSTGVIKYSASYSALRKRLGIGTKKALQILVELKTMCYEGTCLINESNCGISDTKDFYESAVEYDNVLNDRRKELSKKKRHHRWELQSSVLADAWFNNSIVDQVADKQSYLSRLIRYGNDDAIRLLLLMHLYNETSYDGVSFNRLHIQFKIVPLFQDNEVQFWHGKNTNELIVASSLSNRMFCLPNVENVSSKDIYLRIRQLLDSLETMGLIKKVVMVFIADSKKATEPSAYYELDIKTKNYAEKRECRAFANKMQKIALGHGFNVGRTDSRFYDDYVFASPAGKVVKLCTVYRLKFAVRNPKNKGVSEGIKLRNKCMDEISDLLMCS